MRVLITGTGGLIGSEAARYYLQRGDEVIGIDNNHRQTFFGPAGDVSSVIRELKLTWNETYKHYDDDISSFHDVLKIFKNHEPDAVIHCAAQPSHDRAADIVMLDFATNAQGTLNVLEATRQVCSASPFIQVSTNKVYGDNPNFMHIEELETRYDYLPCHYAGVNENMSIDHCKHSLFGVSKTTGDLYAQEYGRYFGLKTGIFRGGCLTGPQHAGVELHGFMSYIVKCAKHKRPYRIFGYKGKQVRDQIHSLDVIRAFDAFIKTPRSGEVYNLGGCRQNSASILETIDLIRQVTGHELKYEIIDSPRIGDHKCYISDMSKFKRHFPDWDITVSLQQIIAVIESVA